jgi:hypothetical protein
MFKFINNSKEIYQCQQAAKAVFNLDLFNPQNALFPRQVFRKHFSSHLFLDFNDWFNEDKDYKKLQGFCQGIKEPTFFADAPTFYLLNPVQFSANCTHADFVKGFTYTFDREIAEHPAQNIGLRLSSETFLYGESLTWAMVNDLTHNVIIVGLESSVLDVFKSSFHERYFNIHEVIHRLEAFQGGRMDGAEQVIKAYS